MTREELDEYLASIGDASLLARFAEARDDLEEAAAQERESERHQACFAAVIVFGQEARRRGLKLGASHAH